MKTITIEIADHDCPELLKLLKNFSARVIKESESAFLESKLDIQQGLFSKDDIDAHVTELFDL
jgi:hypothetical protein